MQTGSWKLLPGQTDLISADIRSQAISFGPGKHYFRASSCFFDGCLIDVHPLAECVDLLGCHFVNCTFNQEIADLANRGVLQNCTIHREEVTSSPPGQ